MGTKWKGGGIPLGYKYDKSKKKLLVDKWVRNQIIKIYQLALEGIPIKDIAKYLNDRNLTGKRGKPWTYKTVSYFFSESRILFYSGYNKDGVKGDWEPIISSDLCSKLLKAETISRKGSRPQTNKYLLTRLNVLVCGYCNGPMKSSVAQKKDSISVKYYGCTNRLRVSRDLCPDSKLVRMEDVDNAVLTDLIAKWNNCAKIRIYTKKLFVKQSAEINENAEKLNKKIKSLMGKQLSSKSIEEVERITSSIEDLNKEKFKILYSKFDLQNIDEFKKSDVPNIKKLKIELQKKIIKNYIDQITVFNDLLHIKYPFAINSKLETKSIVEF